MIGNVKLSSAGPGIYALPEGNRNPRVAIIGAGMSGMLAAIRLREAGIEEFTIYEKATRIGGTWRENTYPGLSCDIPAHMYTYSFEANAEWSHRYARGPEIQAYFEKVSRKYDLLSRIRFDTELVSARYDNGQWHLRTRQGEIMTADMVICATGVLHHPSYPQIEGLERFEGVTFHTARWDHGVDLNGKQVGIIGTGSTSVQIVPQLVPKVKKLSLFQRTPQWIYPLPDKTYSEQAKARIRQHPWIGKWLRSAYSALFNWTFTRAVVGESKLFLGYIAWRCRRHLETKVTDPALREKLRPSYKAACKRLIFGRGFYEALQQPNAALVTEDIERVEPGGIVTRDGRLHELDVLVLATGFKGHAFMRPMEVIGEDGLTIDEAWTNGAQAYRSVTMPGFPNFFMLLGPNSPIGNFSLISISEIQMDYILQLIDLYRQGRADQIEPKPAATRRFNQSIKAAMGKTVWVSGCQSWYLDQNGNPALWPWSFDRFRKEMRTPAFAEFALRKRHQAPNRRHPKIAA